MGFRCLVGPDNRGFIGFDEIKRIVHSRIDQAIYPVISGEVADLHEVQPLGRQARCDSDHGDLAGERLISLAKQVGSLRIGHGEGDVLLVKWDGCEGLIHGDDHVGIPLVGFTLCQYACARHYC